MQQGVAAQHAATAQAQAAANDSVGAALEAQQASIDRLNSIVGNLSSSSYG